MSNTTSTSDTLLDKEEDSDYGALGINEKLYDEFSYISNIYLTSVICFIGLAGNVTGLFVLKSDPARKKMTMYVYLVSLLIVDILYLLYGIFVSIVQIIEILDWNTAEIINFHILRYRGFIDMLLNHATATMIIAMSIERLMALVRPFKVNSSVLVRYSKTIIFTILLVSTLYLSPLIFGVEANEFVNAENKTLYFPRIKPAFKEVIDTVTFTETLLLHYFAPISILIINIGIVVAYSKFSKQRAKTLKPEKGSDNHAKVTVIVTCIAGLYILLSLPNVFVQTLIFFDPRYRFGGKYQMTFRFFINIGDLLARINASIDFIIYILASSKYRHLLMSVCCISCKAKQGSKYSENQSSADKALASTDTGLPI